MNKVIFWFSVAAVAWCSISTATAQQAPKPNIIIIMSDDMGYSDLGCYGGEIRTPRLDELAANGLRYTQFYNTARCCPTRASLLTGLYAHQAGIGHMMNDLGPNFPGYRGDLNRHTPTIAEVLKPAGYRNYICGKWHVTPHTGPEGPKHNWPLQRGFDRFYGAIAGAGSFYDPGSLVRDDTMISAYADEEYQPETYYYTDAISDHAVRFVNEHAKEHGDKPFFMYIPYTTAHWPMHALPEDIEKYKGKYDQGYEPIRKARLERLAELGLADPNQGLSPGAKSWDNVKNKEWEARCMEVYAAMIDRMDQGIGKLVNNLKENGQLDNTLILFLQDNGGCAENLGRQPTKNNPSGPRADKPTLPAMKPTDFQLGSRPQQTREGFPMRMGPESMPGPYDTYIAYGQGWANVSNTPFREYKHWVHEGGIATPLIAHWPKGITAGGEIRHDLSHLIDLLPTCVDLAGVDFPKQLAGQATVPPEGVSLAPSFVNKPLNRDTVFWEHEGNRAVRQGHWKLVAKHNRPWELYDLSKDRVEGNDLSSEYPDKTKELIAKYEGWAARAQVEPWPVGKKK